MLKEALEFGKTKKQELLNIFWLLIDKGIRLLVGVIIGVYVARYLGPSDYGTLNLVKTFYFTLIPLTTMGLQQIVVKEILSKPKDQFNIIGSSIVLSLMGSFSAFLLLNLIGAIFSDGDKIFRIMLFVASFSYLAKPIQVISFVYEARLESKKNVISLSLGVLVSSLFKAYLVLTGAKLVDFVYSFLLDSIICLILLCLFAFKDRLFVQISYSLKQIGWLLIKSWPLMIAGFSVIFYMQIDKIMLGYLMTSQDVGIYSAATQLSEVFYFLPVILTTTFFPSMTEKFNNSISSFEKYFKVLNKYYVLFALIIIAIMLIFSRKIVLAVFGIEYFLAAEVLSVHIIALIFVAMGVLGSRWILLHEAQKFIMYKSLIGAFVNILLNLILIPRLGIIGCAYATVISQFTSAVFLNLLNPKLRKLFFLQLNLMR